LEEPGKCPLELIAIYTVLKVIFSEKKSKIVSNYGIYQIKAAENLLI
jgi:hypothetical protein